MSFRKSFLSAAVAAMFLGAGLTQAGSWFGGADKWSADERAQLASLQRSQLPAPPPDASNRYVESAAAARLGKQLFSDLRFSRNGAVSCATCHNPKGQFEDGLKLGRGVAEGARRTMPAVDLRHSAWLFWDGRKDSLWSQALGPLEDPKEHGGNRLRYVRLLQQHYRAPYEQLFGPLPDLSRLPQDASPLGTDAEKAAWRAMDEAARDGVSRAFANMGKAIAAFEATLRYGDSRVDQYIAGVLAGKPEAASVLNAQEKAGLRLFIGKAQCITCHTGPLLTDHHFHNTGIPPHDAKNPERGRAAAVAAVLADEFNCLGKFSDAKPPQCQELRFIAANDPHMVGAFKTPSLRNVALRPPYMHSGQFATLEDVVRHYARAPEPAIGHSELKELKPRSLSEADMAALVAVLKAFSGPVVEAAAP